MKSIKQWSLRLLPIPTTTVCLYLWELIGASIREWYAGPLIVTLMLVIVLSCVPLIKEAVE